MIIKKQIHYQEQLLTPFISYTREKRNILLLEMGYQNDLQRELCHILCEEILEQNSPLIKIDQKLLQNLKKKLPAKNLLNIEYELNGLLQKMQNDQLALIFDKLTEESEKILIITGEQTGHHVYNFYKVGREYQKIQMGISGFFPQGNKVLSDVVIDVNDFFEEISTKDYDTKATVINIKIKNNLYVYVPSNMLTNFHTVIRLFIKNTLFNQNKESDFHDKEFPYFLASGLNIRLFELYSKIENPSDEEFWALFNNQYAQAKKKFLDRNDRYKLSPDLQLAVFLNEVYLQYQNKLEQAKNKTLSKVNDIVNNLANSFLRDNTLLSETAFDQLFIRHAELLFDEEQIQEQLQQIKENSLKNNLADDSKYPLLFLGNNYSENFVIHKNSFLYFFKTSLEKTAQATQTNIYQTLLDFILYSSCNLEALKETPFYNLTGYREYIEEQISLNSRFLSEVFKRPQIIYQFLLKQKMKIKEKKQLIDLFFVKGSINNNLELLPIEEILKVDLNTILKNIYNSDKKSGKILIPWWRRFYLFITGKKKFIFDEFYEISKNVSRNDDKKSQEPTDRSPVDNNKQQKKFIKKIITTKKKQQPQNLDEATAQFKKALEDSYQQKDNW